MKSCKVGRPLSLSLLCIASLHASDLIAQEVLWEVRGDAPRTYAGSSIASVPDVDGDGISEVLVGARDLDQYGKAWLRSGRDGHELFVWVGPKFKRNEGNSNFGSSVTSTGDVNGDGVADVAIGAPYEKARDGSGLSALGAVFVYSGSDGSLVRELRGDADSSLLGFAVQGLGDVDADGTDDLLVTAPGAIAADGVQRGAVFVYSGRDGALLQRVDYDRGTTADHEFTYGGLAARVPDTDGDGVDDWAVSARFDPDATGVRGTWGGSIALHSGRTGARRWRVFGGASDFLGTGLAMVADWTGDGVADLVVGASQDYCRNGYAQILDGTTGAAVDTWTGKSIATGYGMVVSSPGDVNGDGRPEVAVEGINRRYSCGSDVITSYDAYLDLISGATKRPLYHWSGFAPSYLLTSPFDDVDGDGLADMIFGASGEPNGANVGAGLVRVLRGAEFWLYGQSVYAFYGPYSFTMGELPGATSLLFGLTKVAGSDTFLPVIVTDFAGRDSATFTFNVPPGLGLAAEFTSFALDATGKIVVTAPFAVSFR